MPTFWFFCVCTLPPICGLALPQAQEVSRQKTKDQNIFPGLLSYSCFSPTLVVAVAMPDQLGHNGQLLGVLDARLTGFIWVAEDGFLLGSHARAGAVLHPHGDGELVSQVLGHNSIRDLGTLPAIEPEDHFTAIHQQSYGPVGGSTGGWQEVNDARGGSYRGRGQKEQRVIPPRPGVLMFCFLLSGLQWTNLRTHPELRALPWAGWLGERRVKCLPCPSCPWRLGEASVTYRQKYCMWENSAINHYTRKKVLKEFRETRLPRGLRKAGKVPGEGQGLIPIDGFIHALIHSLTCQPFIEHPAGAKTPPGCWQSKSESVQSLTWRSSVPTNWWTPGVQWDQGCYGESSRSSPGRARSPQIDGYLGCSETRVVIEDTQPDSKRSVNHSALITLFSNHLFRPNGTVVENTGSEVGRT